MGSQFRYWSFMPVVAMAMIIVLSLSHSSMVSGAFYSQIEVTLVNILEPGKILHVHCKSRDDDLGDHYIPYSQPWYWSFYDNLFDTTLFWCKMDWNKTGGPMVSGSFEIYHARRDLYRCGSECFWRIAEDGLYSLNSRKNVWQKLFNWP